MHKLWRVKSRTGNPPSSTPNDPIRPPSCASSPSSPPSPLQSNKSHVMIHHALGNITPSRQPPTHPTRNPPLYRSVLERRSGHQRTRDSWPQRPTLLRSRTDHRLANRLRNRPINRRALSERCFNSFRHRTRGLRASPTGGCVATSFDHGQLLAGCRHCSQSGVGLRHASCRKGAIDPQPACTT